MHRRESVTESHHCLVLGVSSGLGRATARSLAHRGYGIFGVHFDIGDRAEAARALEAELATSAGFSKFFNENAASPEVPAMVVEKIRGTIEDGTCIAALVHSLSFGSLLPFISSNGEAAINRARMDMTLAVMAHSLVYWVQELVRAKLLGDGSHIIAFTSAGTSRVAPGYGAVSAAKATLESHVRQLAVELAPLGIAVNAIRAGVTRTPAFEKIPNADLIAARAEAANPHGRLTTPEDVGEAVALLASAKSNWITGNVIGADGGEILTT
jgi:enoyl-[acyl-carrier protein] reductase III